MLTTFQPDICLWFLASRYYRNDVHLQMTIADNFILDIDTFNKSANSRDPTKCKLILLLMFFSHLLALMNPNIRCVLSESTFDETHISPWRTEIVLMLPIFNILQKILGIWS